MFDKEKRKLSGRSGSCTTLTNRQNILKKHSLRSATDTATVAATHPSTSATATVSRPQDYESDEPDTDPGPDQFLHGEGSYREI